ncbi:6409_t:CDS:1 [Gigaspora margarita]|uniref:6409_t:CDS:1 n=1 Tax=Gigaspora margarita TaxID=4874 RepID=A0ABN7V0V8_GIGMA|nr:6409_t:CDS:1 [Gigaspora margarita]
MVSPSNYFRQNQNKYITDDKTVDTKNNSKTSEETKNYLNQQEKLRYQDYRHRHVGSIFGGNLADRLSEKLKQEKTERYPYNRSSKDYDNNQNNKALKNTDDDNYFVKDRHSEKLKQEKTMRYPYNRSSKYYDNKLNDRTLDDDDYFVKDRDLVRQQKIQRLIDDETDKTPFSHERHVLGERRIETWGRYPVRKIERSRSNPLSKKNMFRYNWPKLFTRLHGIQDKKIQHFQRLRENKQYRWEHRLTLVQGEKNILDLVKKNHPIKSLIVTAPNKPKTQYEIQPPALDYLENPNRIIADNYYLMNIDMVRKILGSGAKPERHELVAEVHFPPVIFPSKEQMNKFLVLEKVNDPHDLGMLTRSTKALGWNGIYLTNKSGDVYNSFAQIVSKSHSLTWPYIYGSSEELRKFLCDNELKLLIAEPLKQDLQAISQVFCKSDNSIFTRTEELEQHDDIIKTPLIFWNGNTSDSSELKLPSRIALLLSRELKSGRRDNETSISIENEMRVGINAPFIDVPSAGSIIMWELNRITASSKNI